MPVSYNKSNGVIEAAWTFETGQSERETALGRGILSDVFARPGTKRVVFDESGDPSLVDADPVAPDLAVQCTRAKQHIDSVANAIRRRYLSLGDVKQSAYRAKLDWARTFKADASITIPNGLQREASRRGLSADQMADLIISKAAEADAVLMEIDADVDAARAAVEAASTVEEIEAAKDSAISNFASIGETP